MDARRFADALDELGGAGTGERPLHAAFVELFPVDGAAVSTLGDLLGSETLSASDDLSARLDELQFDLGEGPCWVAMNTGRPVAERDAKQPSRRWPAFQEAVAAEDVGAIVALPLVVGPLRIGAIDLYSRAPGELDPESISQGEAMANLVARRVLMSALARVGRDEPDVSSGPLSRRVLHQATGIVLAQLGLSASDARLVIEGHAFATERPVLEVAQRIVDRDLVLGLGEGEDGNG